jgi:MFS family permease
MLLSHCLTHHDRLSLNMHAGNIASIFMVDWLGRRLTACICLAGACVAALLFAFAPADPFWSVTAACIFNGISVGGWNALDLLSAELFATEVRPEAAFIARPVLVVGGGVMHIMFQGGRGLEGQ